jgi:ParB/RepB/Spo0J family partition protein
LRLGPLKKSLASEGQQLPIVVRKVGKTKAMRYQIISGFRRATAMRELGYATIAAIIREDLEDDEAAFKASVIENEQRKTYSAIDRALVILGYKKAGYSSVAVGDLMGLTRKQASNIMGLLTLPQVVQDAIDEPDGKFTATHGLTLRTLLGKYPGLDAAKWVETVKAEGLSVKAMKRAVNKAHRPASRPPLGSIFNAGKTDTTAGVYRLSPVRVVVADLSSGERDALKAELRSLLEALG